MSARGAIGRFPILIGSGANKINIKNLLSYADGAIVSTALKEGGLKKGEINIKNWRQRISRKKVKELIKEIK